MTVKELIHALELFSADAEVWLTVDDLGHHRLDRIGQMGQRVFLIEDEPEDGSGSERG